MASLLDLFGLGLSSTTSHFICMPEWLEPFCTCMHANPLYHWVPYGLGSELNQELNIKSAAAQRARMAAE